MRYWLVAILVCLLTGTAWPREKKGKKQEEITQTLEIPKDPPATVVAETDRVVFQVSPLSSRGLLSQQLRDGLKALFRSTGKASIVKLRAFVSGSGDMRRVHDIVSEMFTDRKQPLPALSIVQVGGLPLEGAQVVLEATAVEKKKMNDYGLVFISGQGATSNKPLDPVVPLAEKSLANLRTALQAAGSSSEDMLRVTCFLSSLDGFPSVRDLFVKAWPGAALNFVQLRRTPLQAVAECEGVARLRTAPAAGLQLLHPDGLPRSANYSQVALVAAPRIILSGTQPSFGFQDSDARLAFKRLQSSLEQAGGSIRNVAFSSIYPLSPSIAEQVRRIRFEFYDKNRPPASTLLIFEGLPSMDSGFAVDVVAIKN